jgi:hypothetical protein
MRTTVFVTATVLFLAIGFQLAEADVWSKKTIVTFSGPVQVPGAVLPAGKYIFRLVDSQSNRNIVRVTNTRGDKTFATILAIPDYRVNATSKTVMYFGESPKGTPVAIKSWFYPGDNFGNRFVYPKQAATEIASTYHQPVPAHTETVAAPPPTAPVTVAAPEQTETVAYEPSTFEKADQADTAGVDGEAVKEEPAQAAAMPKTASPLFLIGGIGALLLAASGLVRRVNSRIG